MFRFIKNFFGGISAFLGGLLDAKKSGDNQALAPKNPKKKSGFFMELEEAEDNKSVAAAKPAIEQKKPEPARSTTATAAPAQPAKVEPAAATKKQEPAGTSASAASNNGKGQPQSETITFAPKFLNPAASSSSRRRPGPSLNNFMDMARQVKTPNA